MNEELISIIMPVYNTEKYIEKSIESVLNQTYKKIELIIIDDGSRDKSPEICDSYAKLDERIRVFHIQNNGVSNARNLGVKNARGKYIMFIDSDDTMKNNMVEKMYELSISNNVDLVKANYMKDDKNELLNHSEIIIKGRYDKKQIDDYIIKNVVLEKVRCYIWLLLVKKELIEKFDERLFIFEDMNLYLMLLNKADSIYITDEVLYYYNLTNESSLTNSKESYKKNIENMILASTVLKETLKENKELPEEYISILYTRIINAIINYLYCIYKNSKKINEVLNMYKELKKDERFLTMLRTFNGKYLSKKERLFCESIINGRKIDFFVMCKIKNIINRKK